jgi:hypothetical protein
MEIIMKSSAMKKLLFVTLVLIAFAAGCRYAPNAELAEARQTILDVKAVHPQAECLDFVEQAEKHLKKAEEFKDNGDFDKALFEAQKARHLADKARRCQQYKLLPSKTTD